jgi:hypothetical protein
MRLRAASSTSLVGPQNMPPKANTPRERLAHKIKFRSTITYTLYGTAITRDIVQRLGRGAAAKHSTCRQVPINGAGSTGRCNTI